MFYAFFNTYGNGSRWADDGDRMGRLRIFNTRCERDSWVMADRCDENGHHREALTHREALPYLVNLCMLYTGESLGECLARGTAWMCGAVLDAEAEARERYGDDWEIATA